MEKFRSKILACFLAVALVVLTTPIGLRFDTESKSIEMQSNKAHAVVPVAGAAAAFLAEIAAASGLTVGEFIATVAGVSAVGVGMGMATDAGINFGNDASVNLGNLVDAADYPAWDTLTPEQQEAWGTKQYYDSAKFNSLMDAFGLGDARDRFYSSSGGSIDYTESETNRLQQLGRIGQNWINNGANSVNDIISSLQPNAVNIYNSYFGASNSKTFNTLDINGWNSQEDITFTVYKTNYVKYVESKTNRDVYNQRASGNDVYVILNTDQGTITTTFFSKDAFTWGYNSKTVYKGSEVGQLPEVQKDQTASSKTYNENTYYVGSFSSTGDINRITDTNCVINAMSISNVNAVIPLLLFRENINLGEVPTNIVGYPEDIAQDGDTNIYYPITGIVPDMDWTEFTTEPEQPPTPEEEDLAEIIELLKRFHFTIDYNLLVQDNPLRSAAMQIASSLNRFNFYNQTGQLKVHDEGVFDAVGDLGTYLGGILNQIQSTLSGFFVTDTATDVIGDLDFPDLGDKAVDLVDTISTLAPFGAMFLISELVAILSQVGKIQSPSLVFDFDFMPGQQYDLTVDVSWLDDAKPVINVACIVTLIVALAGATARLIELEAAA